MSEFIKSDMIEGMELLKSKALTLKTQNTVLNMFAMDQVDKDGKEYKDFRLEVQRFTFLIRDKSNIHKDELEAYDLLITVLMHDLDAMRQQISEMQKKVIE